MDNFPGNKVNDQIVDESVADFIKSFLNSISDPVFVLNAQSEVVDLNEAARVYFKNLGYGNDEKMTGVSYLDLLNSVVDSLPDTVINVINTVSKRDSASDEVTFTTGINDSEKTLKLLLNSFEFNDQRYLTVIHKNYSQFPSEAGDGHRSKSELLEELHETTRSLMEARSVDEVATRASEIASDYFDFATVGVRLLEDGKLRMHNAVEKDERLEGRMPPAYEPGEGFVGKAFEEGEPVVHDDLRAASDEVSFDYSPMRSAMLLPLGEFGIIGAASGERGAFDEQDLELGRQFAADVESAMERAQREETIRIREKDLRETTVGRNYLRSILDTLPAGLFIMDLDGTIKRTNQFLRTMLEYGQEELQGVNANEIIQGGDRTLDEVMADALSEDAMLQKETFLITRNGDRVAVHLSGDELKQAGASGREVVFTAIDISERKEKSQALQESKRRLSLALNVAKAGVWEWNLKTGEEFWDESTERLFGLEPGEFEGEYLDFLKRIHPEDREELEEAVTQAIETKSTFEKEFRTWSGSNEERWLMSRGEIFTDDDGNPETMLGATVDITERKRSQLALEESIKEIHHRVKNNMQIINSFLSMQSRNVDSERIKRAYRESKNRVRAMAMVHEKLYQTTDFMNVDFKDYLLDLVDNLVSSNNLDPDVDIDITVDDHQLDLDECIASGLIVNELVTNAFNHGLNDSGHNRIDIQLVRTESGDHCLSVEDNGSGFDETYDPEESRSTGLDIVNSLVDFELDGSVEFENDDGAKVTVVF